MNLGKIKGVLDIGPVQADNCHGTFSNKDIIVLHETVSPDYAGWKDVISISQYLDNKDYGIHGITDKEGHIAWAYGKGSCVFYHTASGLGLINSRGIGIEMISNIMLIEKDNTNRWEWWWKRNAQIDATAKLIAWVSKVHKIPLVYTDGHQPGITTHWQITDTFDVVGGHVDCWPRHKGGYFPVLRIIERARYFRSRV